MNDILTLTSSSIINNKINKIQQHIINNIDKKIISDLVQLYNLRIDIKKCIFIRNNQQRDILTKKYLIMRSEIILYITMNKSKINNDLLKLSDELLYD